VSTDSDGGAQRGFSRKAFIVVALRAGGISDWRQLCGLSGISPQVLRESSTTALEEAARRCTQSAYSIRGEVRCQTCNSRINVAPCVACDFRHRRPIYKFLRLINRSNKTTKLLEKEAHS